MKKYTIVISLIAILVTPSLLLSINCEDYFPSKKNVDLKIYSTTEKVSAGYKYSYALSSSLESVQDVWDLIVEHGDSISNVISPDGWIIGNTEKQTLMWWSSSAEHNIAPSKSLVDFSFESAGLPIIVTYYVHGWVEPPVLEGELSQEEEDACADAMDIFKNAFKGRTIGPTAPPKELNPVAFINGIISMKHEAATLGWITNKGIEISLDQKLENAKKKLEQGNTTAAKNILNALINEVEAQGCESYETKCPEGKHLKPEAYALLKYNARYLADNLK